MLTFSYHSYHTWKSNNCKRKYNL